MGMYTGLRFKAIIKKEYREDIKIVMESRYWEDCKHKELIEFNEVIGGCDSIPFGELCYMPDQWKVETGKVDKYGYEEYADTDGFEAYFNEHTGLWCFQCSLKNYESEIEYFLENVATLIVEKSIHIEKIYEQWESSIMYEIKDGKLIESRYRILYDEEEYYENTDETVYLKYSQCNFNAEEKYRNTLKEEKAYKQIQNMEEIS